MHGRTLVRPSSDAVRLVSGWTVGRNYTVPAAGSFEERMRGLNGLRLGAQGGAEGIVVPSLARIRRACGSPTSPTTAHRSRPMQKAEVDAVLADDATVSTVARLGVGSTYFSLVTDPPAELRGMIEAGLVVTRETLARHPDLPDRPVRAMDRTASWSRDPADLGELHRITVEVVGVPDAPDLEDRLAVLAPTVTARIERSDLQRSLDVIHDSGQVRAQPRIPVDDFFDPAMIIS